MSCKILQQVSWVPQEPDSGLEICFQKMHSGVLPESTPRRQRREQDCADGKVQLAVTQSQRGFCQPHGELWNKDGPASFSRIGMRDMDLSSTSCKLSLQRDCDPGCKSGHFSRRLPGERSAGNAPKSRGNEPFSSGFWVAYHRICCMSGAGIQS